MFNQFFQRLKEVLGRRKENFTELPSGIKTGLAKYLKPDEEILFTLLNFRAIYKAPALMDSNTFFNSWFILTNRRIIVAKNSSSFNKFRDISHNAIDQIHYETGALESKLIINSPGTVDIIEFLRESRIYREDLDIRVNSAIEEAKRSGKHPGVSDIIFCSQCGSKIPKESKFCSECGRSTKSLS
jgi:hypothetical protein